MKIENKKKCKLCDNSSQTEKKLNGECQKHGNDSKTNVKGVISIHDILGIDNDKIRGTPVPSPSPQPNNKHLPDDKSSVGLKRHHIENFLPTTAAAAVAAASQYVSQFPGLFSPYLNDMFLAHLLRGYYQPAGPLITTSHLVAGPQNLSKSSIPLPLDSSPLQQTQSPSLVNEGADLSLRPSAPPPTHTFRYSSQPTQPQSQQQPPIQISPGPYSRPMHQMHCPTYPPYYAYSQDMCYSTPYQPYYPPKVYPAPYRRYMPAATYYSPQPNEMYETTAPQGVSGPGPANGSLQPSPAPLQAPSSQLVPSGPQHLEHYTPYYSGYSPGGGQCYTRSIQPPYMDAPTYQNSCPCPMQSCSKNVHTGPLIGSKTGKGPGQTNNHLVAPSLDNNLLLTSSMTSTPSSISGGSITSTTISVPPPKKITYKLDESNKSMNLVVKPETIIQTIAHNVSSIDIKTNGIKNLAPHEKNYEKTVIVPHHPSYSLNPKLVEPEMSISPARGSTGLPGIPPVQDSATQPLDIIPSLPSQNNSISTSQEPLSYLNGVGRRARVGKSMAREMVKQSHQNFLCPQLDGQQSFDKNHEVLNLAQHNRSLDKQHSKVFPETKESHPEIIMPMPISIRNNNNILKQLPDTLIKKENVKKECDEVVIILDKSESDSSTTQDLLDDCTNDKLDKTSTFLERNPLKRIIDETGIEKSIICLDDTFDGSEAVKRRKIMEYQINPNKKSPPNGYKRLIKPSDPKAYLCKSDQRRRKYPRQKIRVVRGVIGQRKIIIKDRKNKKVVLASSGSAVVSGSPKRKLNRCLVKKPKLLNNTKTSDEGRDVRPEKKDVQHSIENTEVETKGCSSSKDCSSSKSSTEQKQSNPEKSTAFSSESKTVPISESTKEKDKFMSNLELTNDRISKGYASDNEVSRKKEKLRNKNPPENRSRSESKKDAACEETTKSTKASKNVSPTRSRAANTKRDRSNSSTKSKESVTAVAKKAAKTANIKTANENQKTVEKLVKSSKAQKSENSLKKKVTVKMQNKQSKKLANTIIDEDILDNETNNNILIENNNKTYEPMREDSPEPMMKANAKKTKSRGNKFSNKKRHRARHVKEIEEVIIPRRASVAPRWSNGWCWEGEPFQGKVFLNSDDYQVARTRYPAMRHECGDLIQPGDCVLLRAGSKKNELPYVAKVASLWENPEDGEMMMSLLWYYRPEHTEQGRQPFDCLDEVFASKHQDHNSVACIEDKCYVLTFNEYFRYRKTIKAIEEGIEELPSIVPVLKQSTGREVPVNTNSELILFCRRVYDFRLKRLIKNPS